MTRRCPPQSPRSLSSPPPLRVTADYRPARRGLPGRDDLRIEAAGNMAGEWFATPKPHHSSGMNSSPPACSWSAGFTTATSSSKRFSMTGSVDSAASAGTGPGARHSAVRNSPCFDKRTSQYSSTSTTVTSAGNASGGLHLTMRRTGPRDEDTRPDRPLRSSRVPNVSARRPVLVGRCARRPGGSCPRAHWTAVAPTPVGTLLPRTGLVAAMFRDEVR